VNTWEGNIANTFEQKGDVLINNYESVDNQEGVMNLQAYQAVIRSDTLKEKF